MDEKPVIAEAIISQPVEKIKHSFSSIKGNKAERLYHLIILQTASRYQVEPALVKAIIMAESGYNPKAISKRGAKGLMQLMPGTAQALGVEDIFNPRQNISGGVRYFKQLVLSGIAVLGTTSTMLWLVIVNFPSVTIDVASAMGKFKAVFNAISLVWSHAPQFGATVTLSLWLVVLVCTGMLVKLARSTKEAQLSTSLSHDRH